MTSVTYGDRQRRYSYRTLVMESAFIDHNFKENGDSKMNEMKREKRISKYGPGSWLSSSLILFGLVLTLGGCQTIETLLANSNSKPKISFNTGPQLPPAAIPRYAVGEAFTYDDKRTDTVIAAKGDFVTWRNDRGIINRQYHDFLLPPVSWQTTTRRSRAIITANTGTLWPLKIGNKARFDVSRVISGNDGSSIRELSQSWQCVVEGTERLTVAAGSFDTFRIPCFRYSPNTSNWRQTRTYYYAPKIGHYVVREDTYVNRPSRRRELFSTGFSSKALPQSDQTTLIRAFRDAMNKNRDDAGRAWTSADGRVSAILTPKRTFKNVRGTTCRDYTSTYRLGAQTRTNNKRACKQADGQWKVVPMGPEFTEVNTPKAGKNQLSEYRRTK